VGPPLHASALTAFLATAITAFFGIATRADFSTGGQSYALLEVALTIVGLIVLTTVGLVLFTRLSESTRSTDEREIFSGRQGLAFERRFINEARRANPSVEADERGWPDLTFKEGDRKVAVELKSQLDVMSTQHLRALIADTERRCDAGGYSCALIVSPRRPSQRATGAETEKVKVVEPSEVLDRMRAAA
jgi:hypothetical protein